MKDFILYQPPTDLFGDVVVTDDDIFNWVAAVAPRWMYNERSFNNYVRSWNVKEKVRQAKLSGHYDSIVSRLTDAPWHDRLAIDMVRSTH